MHFTASLTLIMDSGKSVNDVRCIANCRMLVKLGVVPLEVQAQSLGVYLCMYIGWIETCNLFLPRSRNAWALSEICME